MSQQDLCGYIYITLKGHHLEQQDTWRTPPPADCLPAEGLFGPAWYRTHPPGIPGHGRSHAVRAESA